MHDNNMDYYTNIVQVMEQNAKESMAFLENWVSSDAEETMKIALVTETLRTALSLNLQFTSSIKMATNLLLLSTPSDAVSAFCEMVSDTGTDAEKEALSTVLFLISSNITQLNQQLDDNDDDWLQ